MDRKIESERERYRERERERKRKREKEKEREREKGRDDAFGIPTVLLPHSPNLLITRRVVL